MSDYVNIQILKIIFRRLLSESPVTKLMRLDQPQAKFRLKSDSNCLLIDFFNPISAAQFIRHYDSILIRTIIRLRSLILDQF